MNDPRFASIDAFAEQNREAILRDITRLVAVPSVEGTPAPVRPLAPVPAPLWIRRWRSPANWAWPPIMPTVISAGPRPAPWPTVRSTWPPSPTAMWCPKVTAGTPTLTPSG